MGSDIIKALTFDTGGTILDWHSGFLSILKKILTFLGYLALPAPSDK